MARPIWSGSISFGLVNIPIKLFPAVTVDIIRRRTQACLREVPDLARSDGVDALLVDEVSWEGATIAEQLVSRSSPSVTPW